MRYLIILVGLASYLVFSCNASDSNTVTANENSTVAINAASNTPIQNKPDKLPEAEMPKPEAKDLTPPQDEAEYISFQGGLKVWPKANKVELKAALLSSQSRALEFLLVGAGGANHEALFQAGCSAEDLKRALEILELKEAESKYMGRGYSGKPTGDRVKISVVFTHQKTGVKTTVDMEDWLMDMRTGKAPEKVGFVFTGSHENFDIDLNRSIIEADLKGNLIALWHDGSCLLDNDREGGVVPDVYSPNPKAEGIPKAFRGKQPVVTLVFEPWKE